jgi:hypothetical protein
MTLLKKIIDIAKEKIDLLFLTRKVNCFIESESISTEEEISIYTKNIEKYIELKNIDRAFSQYEELKRKKRRLEDLKEFKKYLLEERKE